MVARTVEPIARAQATPQLGGATVRVVPLANAAALVGLAAYLICAFVSLVAPEALLWVAQSWVHSLALGPMRPAGWFSPAQFVVGLITFPAFVWLVTAASARLYQAWR